MLIYLILHNFKTTPDVLREDGKSLRIIEVGILEVFTKEVDIFYEMSGN